MLRFRLALLCLHLLAGLLICALLFPFAGDAARARHVRKWSVRLLRLCRVEVDIADTVPAAASEHALVVANHISWLDIFVINTWQPCRFVAKADIRGWPLLGWLCERAGTIFIERGSLRAVRRIYEHLVHRLQCGEPVAFFPEGTTSEQGTVLPFHANLFEAAIEAQVPVQPFALRYLDAGKGYHPAVSFVGDTSFLTSLKAILNGGPIRAELVRLPQIATAGCHRRDLAREVRRVIALQLEAPPVQKAA